MGYDKTLTMPLLIMLTALIGVPGTFVFMYASGRDKVVEEVSQLKTSDSILTANNENKTIQKQGNVVTTGVVSKLDVKEAQKLIQVSGCMGCHKEDIKLVGPSLHDISEKYEGKNAVDDLVKKVVKGGKGNWGEIPMPPHAHLKENDIKIMVSYILSLKKNKTVKKASDESTGKTPYTNADASTRGQALFSKNCAACHMYNGEGKPGLAPSIRNRDFLAIASDEFIKKTITQGREGTLMVAQKFSENDLKDLISYMRSFKSKNPVSIKVDDKKKIKGDLATGKKDFALYCAQCHGDKGEGYRSGGSGPGIGLKGFLNVASDDYIFQTIKQGRIGTAMMPFAGSKGLANLTDDQMNNIVVFLRSLNK